MQYIKISAGLTAETYLSAKSQFLSWQTEMPNPAEMRVKAARKTGVKFAENEYILSQINSNPETHYFFFAKNNLLSSLFFRERNIHYIEESEVFFFFLEDA